MDVPECKTFADSGSTDENVVIMCPSARVAKLCSSCNTRSNSLRRGTARGVSDRTSSIGVTAKKRGLARSEAVDRRQGSTGPVGDTARGCECVAEPSPDVVPDFGSLSSAAACRPTLYPSFHPSHQAAERRSATCRLACRLADRMCLRMWFGSPHRENGSPQIGQGSRTKFRVEYASFTCMMERLSGSRACASAPKPTLPAEVNYYHQLV